MTDRNEQARQDFARRKAAAEMAAGRAAPLDRLGAPIQVGSLVLWHPPYDLVYQVDSITPVLDPRAPAGLVQMNLSIKVPIQAALNQVATSMIVVGFTDGAAHSQLITPDGASPRPEPEKPSEDGLSCPGCGGRKVMALTDDITPEYSHACAECGQHFTPAGTLQ
jgi:hypothetical protein